MSSDGKATANVVTFYDVPDLTMQGWKVELSHGERWDCVQVASVNDRSHLRIEADSGDGDVQFTGWRITLDAKGLDRLIQEAINLRARLNTPNPAAGENAGTRVR